MVGAVVYVAMPRELFAAHIESGVVRYEARLFFDIKYSSVKALRIDVPKDIADKVRNLLEAKGTPGSFRALRCHSRRISCPPRRAKPHHRNLW